MEINARTQPGVRVRVTCPNTNKQVLGTLRSVMPSSTPGCWVARIDPDDKDHFLRGGMTMAVDTEREKEALRRWWCGRTHSALCRRWCRYYLRRLQAAKRGEQ